MCRAAPSTFLLIDLLVPTDRNLALRSRILIYPCYIKMLHSWKLGIKRLWSEERILQLRLKQQRHLLFFFTCLLWRLNIFYLQEDVNEAFICLTGAFFFFNAAPELFQHLPKCRFSAPYRVKKELSEVCLWEPWVTHAVLYDTLAFPVWSFYTASPLYFTSVDITELGVWITIFSQSLKHIDSLI